MFQTGKLATVKDARAKLDSIKNSKAGADELEGDTEKAKMKMGKKGVLFFRLIGLLFDPKYRETFGNINNIKTKKDFEILLGRKDERFYNNLASEINDDQCPTTKMLFLLALEKDSAITPVILMMQY